MAAPLPAMIRLTSAGVISSVGTERRENAAMIAPRASPNFSAVPALTPWNAFSMAAYWGAISLSKSKIAP
jgi:hypothetical protein